MLAWLIEVCGIVVLENVWTLGAEELAGVDLNEHEDECDGRQPDL